MFKIFYKSLFSTLLIVILIANIAFATGLGTYLSLGRVNALPIDYENSFIGFSTFFNFIELNDWQIEPLDNIKDFVSTYNGWVCDLSVTVFSVTSWGVLDFIYWFFTYVVLGFLNLFNVVMMIVYALTCMFFLVINVFNFMGGGFSTGLPPFTYGD